MTSLIDEMTSEKNVRSFSDCCAWPKMRPDVFSTRADSRRSHNRTRPLLLL